MNKKINEDFFKAWYFLLEHSYYQHPNHRGTDDSWLYTCFPRQINIDVVKVNPVTDRIDDDERFNTKVKIWLETGSWLKEDQFPDLPSLVEGYTDHVHDMYLDSVGDTFEEAVIDLASRMKVYYDDKGERTDIQNEKIEAFFEELNRRAEEAEENPETLKTWEEVQEALEKEIKNDSSKI